MKPTAFQYYRPDNLDEAVSLLAQNYPDAKILAGGQSLVPMMNFRLARPNCLIDLGGIKDLSYIQKKNGSFTIGAMTTQSEIENSDLLATGCPILVEATKFIGHTTIRNQGTIGGSIAHADPAAEYPALLLALEGQVVVCGPNGKREISSKDFFVTLFTTALEQNEIVTEIRLPNLESGAGWAFVEISRRYGDYGIIAVAAIITLDNSHHCKDVRISLAGVGMTPLRCYAAEAFLKGNPPDTERFREVAKRSAAMSEPTGDLHATAEYKRAMIEVFVEKALTIALSRVGR